MNCPNCQHMLTDAGWCFGCRSYPLRAMMNITTGADSCPPPNDLRAQLQEARRQIAEKDAELERLKNPGATQYCPACVEAQKEIAALKTKRQATIDAAIKMLRIIETDHIDRGYELRLKGVRTALEAVEQIRARYQGEK